MSLNVLSNYLCPVHKAAVQQNATNAKLRPRRIDMYHRRPSPLSLSTSLCLACSSSLPPRKSEEPFLTPCCSRPICPACLRANPRLARYNPCLHCLSSVQALSSRSKPEGRGDMSPQNIDGGVHDDVVFAIGDDQEDTWDEDESPDVEELHQNTSNIVPDMNFTGPEQGQPTTPDEVLDPKLQTTKEAPDDAKLALAPSQYYIKPGDTLLGIALRFGVDVGHLRIMKPVVKKITQNFQGHHICRMNSLPQSTLRTTPHLLHTRTVLILPPNARMPKTSPDLQERFDHDERRVRERAEKRLQVLTKETDWRVAKAYVALAEVDPNVDDEADHSYEDKLIEGEKKARNNHRVEESLEGRAIDRYLDDEEWEQRERREGRGVLIPRFPLIQDPFARNAGKGKGVSSWWGWKN